LDKLAFALRTPPPGDALLETTRRRSGQARVTPVCDCLEGDTGIDLDPSDATRRDQNDARL